MALLEDLELVANSILPFLFVLSLVVFFHELGHFLIGRGCGVKVDTFSLGPEIFGFDDRRGTHWRLAAIPLGGYVKFHGSANWISPEDERAAATLPLREREAHFFSQKVWKRAAIVAAGPIANFILAFVIFSGIFYLHGRTLLSPVVASVAAGSSAEAAGFQPGDRILSVDGAKAASFEDVQRAVQAAPGRMLHIRVNRRGKIVDLFAAPRWHNVVTRFGSIELPILGVQADPKPQNWHIEHYGLATSVKLGASETGFVATRTASYVKEVVAGRQSTAQLSGPIGIAEVSDVMAKIGPAALFDLAAIVSISIGMLNLLPIPLLDGGHLLYYAVEAIRGKPMNAKAPQIGFSVGFALLASLFTFATYHDILHLTPEWLHW